MTGRGRSHQDHHGQALFRHISDKANPSSSHAYDEKDDPTLLSMVKLIETFRAEIHCSMGTLQSTVDSFGSRLTVVETSLQDFDNRITAFEAKCEALENSNKLLMAKTEDLKSRSRRQNL